MAPRDHFSAGFPPPPTLAIIYCFQVAISCCWCEEGVLLDAWLADQGGITSAEQASNRVECYKLWLGAPWSGKFGWTMSERWWGKQLPAENNSGKSGSVFDCASSQRAMGVKPTCFQTNQLFPKKLGIWTRRWSILPVCSLYVYISNPVSRFNSTYGLS
jgi:hypothetical protein